MIIYIKFQYYFFFKILFFFIYQSNEFFNFLKPRVNLIFSESIKVWEYESKMRMRMYENI